MSAAYLQELFGLDGQVAVVIGGTGVLGGELCKGLAQAGAHVVVAGRSAERGQACVEAIGKLGCGATFIDVDACSRESITALLQKTLDQHGRVDALVNAAGGNQPGATITPEKTFLDLDMSAYRQVLGLNLDGTVVPSLVFAKTFAAQKRGNIINFSSMAASSSSGSPLKYSGSPKYSRYLVGNGAKKPKNSCGMIGNEGSPSNRANDLRSATEGYCSSAPITATGTIGERVCSAKRMKPGPNGASL